jgi:hypothetical protein
MGAPVMAKFRLLGPVEAYLDGRKVELPRPQLRTVLAVLAAEAGRPVSAETLIDRVWNDDPPAAASWPSLPAASWLSLPAATAWSSPAFSSAGASLLANWTFGSSSSSSEVGRSSGR